VLITIKKSTHLIIFTDHLHCVIPWCCVVYICEGLVTFSFVRVLYHICSFSVLFKYLNIIEFGALMNLDQREEVTRKYRVISSSGTTCIIHK
jgi:hypothetical protein